MMPYAPHPDLTIIASSSSAHPNHLGSGGVFNTVRKGLLISALCVVGLAAAVLVPLKPWVNTNVLPLVLPALNQSTNLLSDAKTPRIDVVLKGIANAKGVIRIAAFDKLKGFPSDEKSAYRLMMVPAKQGKVSVSINDVPTGKFAIVVYHDQNNNNKLDLNILGIPIEQYGVSNNARKRLSAPKFREALFAHDDTVTTIEIELR